MTSAPQGACFGRAPPSLRSPPVITAIDLPGRTYRKIWTQLLWIPASGQPGKGMSAILKRLPRPVLRLAMKLVNLSGDKVRE